MAKTKVIWTATALDDLAAIGDFIAQESPERAISFTEELLESTIRLESFPFSGGLCPEDLSSRQITLKGYRIIYQVTEQTVEVLTIISPGRDALRILRNKP